MSPETTLALYASAVIFAAALVSSIAGVAFSALAGAPLLALFQDPVRAVGVMVACSIAIQAYSVWALRWAIDWRRLAPFVAPGLATVPLGVAVLTRAGGGVLPRARRVPRALCALSAAAPDAAGGPGELARR